MSRTSTGDAMLTILSEELLLLVVHALDLSVCQPMLLPDVGKPALLTREPKNSSVSFPLLLAALPTTRSPLNSSLQN